MCTESVLETVDRPNLRILRLPFRFIHASHERDTSQLADFTSSTTASGTRTTWLDFLGAHFDLSDDDHLRDRSTPVVKRRNELEPSPEHVHPLVYYCETTNDGGAGEGGTADEDAGVLVLAVEDYGPSDGKTTDARIGPAKPAKPPTP